jgi:hypothetical protein
MLLGEDCTDRAPDPMTGFVHVAGSFGSQGMSRHMMDRASSAHF